MNKGMTVSVRNITKSFVGVKALDSVSLDFVAGKVHGLIGANGAGKSTLIKILAGVYNPDSGQILLDGSPVVISDPSVAAGLGLRFIHQELHLVPHFNTVENLTLGLKKIKRGGLIDWNATAKQLEEVLGIVGFTKSPFTPIKDLSVAEQWLVAIAKALYQNVRFIAMDEPTAALSESEVERLFEIVRNLAERGIGVIYVSHRLDEVIELCDEITVFKDGIKVMHEQTDSVTKEEIITAIAGHKVETLDATEYTLSDEDVLLSVENLKDDAKLKGMNLTLKRGEVLGLTGLVGAGRTETALAVFGANRLRSGSMTFDGKDYAPRRPADAVNAGIVIIPEDRRNEGLITKQTLSFNVNLPTLEILRKIRLLPLISMRKGTEITENAIDKLKIKAGGVNVPVLSLSGGNQQKVVIGKWLQRSPKLIIMDEPTQGVDVGARAEIYKLIRQMAKEGSSFLIVSSDLEELPGLCDRVVVMNDGKVSGELTGRQITKETMLRLCYAHEGGNGNDGQEC